MEEDVKNEKNTQSSHAQSSTEKPGPSKKEDDNASKVSLDSSGVTEGQVVVYSSLSELVYSLSLSSRHGSTLHRIPVLLRLSKGLVNIKKNSFSLTCFYILAFSLYYGSYLYDYQSSFLNKQTPLGLPLSSSNLY
ncbi:hypothetical protein NECAME_09321 [Necator americanus]|uniref:Uncharacterized protein n=1 Tax=Necator americanus TaxID=51031 RepID=W2TEC7_NECAM|nr:hypothetical protein NECAME_09321 [Necator americanus]ETN80188.1 hypothetical protein NECAME_09321 [Necator americanus]